MGTIIWKGWMKENDPRYNSTSVVVGKSLSLRGRPKATKDSEDEGEDEPSETPSPDALEKDSNSKG